MRILARLCRAPLVWLAVILWLPHAAMATEIQVVRSAGGITAWLVQEPSIPLLSVSFSFAGGASLDQPSRKGTGNLVSGLLDEGAGPYNSLAFQTRLEELAVRMNFDADRDSFSGSLRTLSANRDAAFELLRLALNEPHFEAEAVARIRRQILTGLIEAQEDPNAIVAKTWFATAFPDHPYGLPSRGSIETVKAITTEDLRGFMAKALARDRLTIGVVGDISAADLGPLLDKTFGALPASTKIATVPETMPKGAGLLKVVEKSIPQSRVMFGAPGLKRDDPDWYAAYVLNYVLGGGGFSSRLNEEVREKRGLAYSVYSYLYPLDHAAIHLGGVGTQNQRVEEALKVIKEQIARAGEAGITVDELANAKTFLNGSFPLRLTSSGRIARLLRAIQRENLGLDYLERRAVLINSVTLEDIRRVAKRLLRPENLLIVVVGQPAGLSSSE
ncbi:MAG: insulinase family protein [Rhodospirillaceae bacterium]|nr:insulinase family protein [Rhodospirillaceae bacterium]MBT3495474.1 insulinase family protein [Rhodospirillaceae bacterium]MBT3780096.1 insulinase family protein [Rhodospirillaceae bacterium]MBT3975483.1 insulinase family protein [Rhodospirillaceae bacterium]MBT4170785.1 insulinase family protein [Rhodospirillaceae bacterium]